MATARAVSRVSVVKKDVKRYTARARKIDRLCPPAGLGDGVEG